MTLDQRIVLWLLILRCIHPIHDHLALTSLHVGSISMTVSAQSFWKVIPTYIINHHVLCLALLTVLSLLHHVWVLTIRGAWQLLSALVNLQRLLICFTEFISVWVIKHNPIVQVCRHSGATGTGHRTRWRYQVPIGNGDCILLTQDNLIKLVSWQMDDFVESAYNFV